MSNAEASSSAHAQQQQQQQQQQRDFDFWEFVYCSKCHLPFSSDSVSGPTVPFWLTECGHIVCNSHLNPNQSCPTCDTQGIELMPLQKDLPAPMSNWFCSLPFKLDSVAQAAKFQQDVLASSVRYFKDKCRQYRHLAERMKAEIQTLKAFKQEVEGLRQENEQLRRGHGLQEPGTSVNANGKRRMVDHRVATSSPRSIHTPLGPPRITLPPDHDPPPSVPKNYASDISGNSLTRPGSRTQARLGDPLGSRGFNQQYAYIPPETPQLQPQQVLSHAQQATARHAAPSRMQTANDRRLMPPPPTPQHARQHAQVQSHAHPMDQNAGAQMSMARPRIPDPSAQGHVIGGAVQPHRAAQQQHASTSHVGVNGTLGPNYLPDQGYLHPQPQPQSFGGTAPQTFALQAQGQNHPSIPLITSTSGHSQHLTQTPRRFKPPSLPNTHGIIPPNTSNGTPRRFVPPTPIASSRFVPSSVSNQQRPSSAGMGMAMPQTAGVIPSASGSSSGFGAGANHHQKRFTPSMSSRTIVPSTASAPQPHAQRTAFMPRKNQFS